MFAPRGMSAVLIVAMAAGVQLPVPSSALAKTTPRTEIIRAAGLVLKIRASYFARGHRRVVIASARSAARLARGRHGSCGVLAGADALLNVLEVPTTWARHRVPAPVVRAPIGLLRSAERLLLRQAGARCARHMKMTKSVRPRKGGKFTPLKSPARENDQHAGRPTPVGRFRPVKAIGGQAGFGAGPFGRGSLRVSAGSAVPASDRLAFFRFADVGLGCCGSPQEPTAAIGGNVVWYTANDEVGLSTDAGRTFRLFRPSTLLKDSGLPFCCDQQVSYSPQYNIFVWVIQYWCATACGHRGSGATG